MRTKISFFTVTLLLSHIVLLAQSAKTVNSIYLYPAFKQGLISNANGETRQGVLNINLWSSTLNVIANSDTLTVENEGDIVSVSIDGRRFLKQKRGYVELMDTNGEISFGILSFIKHEQEVLKGAYGIDVSTASVQKVSSLPSTNGEYGQILRVEGQPAEHKLEYPLVQESFLIKGNRYIPATEKAFLKQFSSKSTEIRSYIEQQDTDFDNNEDLVRLFKYAISL